MEYDRIIKSLFNKAFQRINKALPPVYGVRPVMEAAESASSDKEYTGDCHGLQHDLMQTVGEAQEHFNVLELECNNTKANYRALGKNVLKHSIDTLYNTCEFLTEDASAFGAFGKDHKELQLRMLLLDVMEHIEEIFPRS